MSMFLPILISEAAFAKIEQLLVLIEEQRDTLWNLIAKRPSYANMVPNPICKFVTRINEIKWEMIQIHHDYEKLNCRYMSQQW